MITSRHPNKRASTENDPGPNRTMATATTSTKAIDTRVANRCGLNDGTTESNAPVALNPTSAAANGVRKPAKSERPVAAAKGPATHVPIAGSLGPARSVPPSMIITMPRATLTSNKPSPVRPVGKAWNKRCRQYLLRLVSARYASLSGE